MCKLFVCKYMTIISDGHAVLKHILHNSRAISVPINTTSIHASSPEGHQMSLHVSPPPSGLGCSVQVSSGDVATLCQTSEAINCRLQVRIGDWREPWVDLQIVNSLAPRDFNLILGTGR